MSSTQHKARLSIVVLGAGVIGRRHAALARESPLWKLTGIAEPDAAGKAYAESLQVPWYRNAHELLDEQKPDAAVIATPSETHKEVALACIDRGIPALIEKPIAGNLEDAAALTSASDRAGVPLLIGHHRRHNPIVRCARTAIEAGLLGHPTVACVLYTFYKPPEYFKVAWRLGPSGGPVLINLIHEIDLVRHLWGEIATVQALVSSTQRHLPVEDTAAVLLRMTNGALVTLSLSDIAVAPWSWDLVVDESGFFPPQPTPVQTHFFCGTEGSLTLPTLEHWSYRGGKSWLAPLTQEALACDPADPYLEQLQHFHRVARNAQAPLVTAADATRTLRATLAVHEAARAGQPVSI